jgi:GTP-binding protein HflX
MSSAFTPLDGGSISSKTKERFDASTHADRMTRMGSVVCESAILVGIYLDGQGISVAPLDELAGLADAAQVREVGRLIQRRRKPEVATYIGSGKLEELNELVQSTDADLVIFDNDLAPSQTKNLEEELKVKVIDRTELILDIFASRARTSEARLAVELAQLEYSLPRLKRMWTHLERQGVGGVGLRGPGEKQLEVDRRLAQKRILDLKEELNTIQQRRQREVSARKKSRTVSLVGYTNAGKSTLLNRLTDSDVYVKDQLFATLDTRTRRWHLPGWGPVLLSDTVGFIRDLPHHLIASFRATLEEANQADLLLHIADATSRDVHEQIAAAFKVLTDLGMREKDTLLVLNKVEALESPERLNLLLEQYPNVIPISAKSGQGIERLTAAVSDVLSKEFLELTIAMSVSNGRLAAMLARDGEILSKHYDETTVSIHCRVPRYLIGRLRNEPDISVLGLPEEPEV